MLPLSGRTDPSLVAACRAGPVANPLGAGKVRDRPFNLPIPRVLIIWSAGLAHRRITQTWAWLNASYEHDHRELVPRTPVSLHQQQTPETRRYDEALELTMRGACWGVCCPTCGNQSPLLMWDDSVDRWRCLARETGCARWKYRNHAHIPVLLGRLQFGLLLGVTGTLMKGMRRDLMVRARQHALKARRVEDVWILSVAAMLLEVKPTWRTHSQIWPNRPHDLPKTRCGHGAFWEAVKPHLMDVIVHELLAPRAYIHQFHRWLRQGG